MKSFNLANSQLKSKPMLAGLDAVANMSIRHRQTIAHNLMDALAVSKLELGKNHPVTKRIVAALEAVQRMIGGVK